MTLSSDEVAETGNAGWIWLVEYEFFACIALVNGLRDPQGDAPSIRKLLDQKRRILEDCAQSAPMNFRHMHLLVSAEMAELEGRLYEATALHEEAIRDAAANGFQQNAAFAAELAAHAYLRRGRPLAASGYLERARAGYETWGAHGKVRAIEEDHPAILRPSPMIRVPLALDTVSIVRASQALSSEISLRSLLERMMRVIMQNSGAQRGTLLVEREGELRIEAHLEIERRLVEVPRDAGTDGHGFVADSIIRYTLRTGEDVVLANATQSGDFTADPYIVAHASKSILSMAVRHRDRISGVLFLENELSTDVFTRERLEVLHLLVAQAAISLENARLYDALSAREGLLRDFFEGMPVGVYVVDAQGRPAFANRRATEIAGKAFDANVHVDEVASTYQFHVAGSEELYPMERMPLARALRGDTSMVDDVEIWRPDRRVPLAVWGTPIRGDDGAVRYAMVAFQDIGQQRAMEVERGRLEAQLHQAERLESIGRLAGGVAHDFNNLLTPMLMYTELAAKSLPSESIVRKQIDQVHEAAAHASGLTRQLLTFGRKQSLALHDGVDLNRELESFAFMFRRVVREDIEIRLQLEPEVAAICADPSQLQRIFLNLGMNAADAMPEGGKITFETLTTPAPVEARGSASDACVALRVRDTGHGMDKEILAKIFDPFFTTKGPGKGTGLGLPTVHGLVQEHGARLSVQSELGKGTTFEILFFPRVHGEAKPVGPAPASEVPKEPLGRGETILLVEDEDAVRKVVEEVLSRDGYRVLATNDPTQALGIARRLGDRLDLLLTDMVMPGMNGRELCDALSRERPNLAVLFMSGYSEDITSASGDVDYGAELMQKPLSVQKLRAKVSEVLAARRTPRA